MKSFRDWKISTKIMGISVFTIVLVVSGILFYLLPLVEKKLLDEKKSATKNVVDVAYTCHPETPYSNCPRRVFLG